MSMEFWQVLASVVVAALGSSVFTALISSHYNQKSVAAGAKKLETDAKTDIAESTLKWAEILTRRIDSLELKIESKDREIVELHKEIASVKTELRMYKEGYATVATPSS